MTPEPHVTSPLNVLGACAACPHAWNAHDALGVRFCTATVASAWTRGCICRPVVVTARM